MQKERLHYRRLLDVHDELAAPRHEKPVLHDKALDAVRPPIQSCFVPDQATGGNDALIEPATKAPRSFGFVTRVDHLPIDLVRRRYVRGRLEPEAGVLG